MFGGMFQRKSFLPAAAVCLFAVFLLDVGYTSAASSGGKCSKVGFTQKTKGVTYSCVRVGKTLKWVRKNAQQGAVTTTAPASMAELLRLNPQSPEPLSNCRLIDARTFKTGGEWQAITYPAVATGAFTNSGNVNIAVVFVDYPDAVGSASELSDALADIKKASAWYSWFSQGNVTYNLRIADRWVRAPKTSNNYFWLHPGKAGTQLMSDVEISDSYKYLASTVVDTSGIAAVWAITPKSATAIDEGFAYRTTPSVFSTGGSTYSGKIPIWQHFVHETLHSHGALGHSPKNTQIGLFWNTGSAGATLNSWDAMTLGWMKQENIFCVVKQNVSAQTLTLVPLEREQVGLRSIVVKLSEYEALVIESHRKDKWSERWPTGTSGVSVMRIDTRVDTVWDLGSSTGKYLVPAQEHSLDFLKVGQSFTADGVKITVLQSADNDQIKIESVG
jgi:hypothetical protein